MKRLQFLSLFHVSILISNCNSLINGNQTKNEPHLLFEIIPDKNPTFMLGSLHTLERLIEFSIKEENLIEVLTERLKLLELERKLISSYVYDYKESTQKAVAGLHDSSKNTPEARRKVVASSAAYAHRMTDRYNNILAKLQGLLSSDIYNENLRNTVELLHSNLFELMKKTRSNDIRSLFSSLNGVPHETELNESEVSLPTWPKNIDKYMSDLSFIKIHETFGFDPHQLQRGLTLNTKYGGHLTAKQCAEIGAHALSREQYYIAIEWLELAKLLSSQSQNQDDTIQADLVSDMLDVAIKEHNINMYNGNGSANSEDFYFSRTYEGQPHYERLRMRKLIFQSVDELDPDADVILMALAKFWGLCSGITFQTPEAQKSLKCFLDTKKHPYLYINPLKTEVLSENPPVLQFYDILSNDTIEQIKAVSVPRLELSQVVGASGLEGVTTYRTSAGTFLQYEEIPKLYHHSEIVSGFKLVGASEMGQVVEYTFGRYYICHSDALGDQEETKEYYDEEGDRAATMLYYLETAEFGGDTPFCDAGVNANAVRGSAVLWLNMYRNGSVRQDVYHGACPVVHGHKIIINHWIRYNGNWDHYKCSLNQFE